MSLYYPSTEEIENALDRLEHVFKDPVVVAMLENQDYEVLAYNEGFFDHRAGHDLTLGDDKIDVYDYPGGFTYDKQVYGLSNIGDLAIAKTVEYDPLISDGPVIKSINPNDPTLIFEVMNRGNANARGTAKNFQEEHGVTTTTHISLMHYEKLKNEFYTNSGLNEHIVKRGPNQSFKGLNPTGELASVGYAKRFPQFHQTLQDQFILVNNKNLAQEALERSRRYDAKGERIDDIERGGLDYQTQQRIAKKSFDTAFELTRQICLANVKIKQVNAAIDKSTQKFKDSLKPKIKSEGFIKGYEKVFKRNKGETLKEAVPRIRREYKDFATKQIEKLEKKGFDVILAQGIAQQRYENRHTEKERREHVKGDLHKDQVVTKRDMMVAQELIRDAKKDPFKYRSTDLIIREVVKSESARETVYKNLDGRSTFQRSMETMEKFGQHMSAYKDGRSRVRKEDRDNGKLFAANSLSGLQDAGLKRRMAETMSREGYSLESAVKAKKSIDRAYKRQSMEAKSSPTSPSKEQSRESIIKIVEREKVRAQEVAKREAMKKEQEAQKQRQEERKKRDKPKGPSL